MHQQPSRVESKLLQLKLLGCNLRFMGPSTFYAKDCNLALIATGASAESLIELRNQLYQIPTASLYYHFWGGRLRVSFVHPQYQNDFARWAYFGLRDQILSERLTIVDPMEYPDLEDLRKKVISIVEDRLDEEDYVFFTRKENQFHFLRSIIMIYDGGISTNSPPDLKTILPKLTTTSIFFHFIDARRRTPNSVDDFSYWLSGFGNQYEELLKKIKQIDPHFLSVSEIRHKLIELFDEHL